MTMTAKRLAELDAVMAKATAGEWRHAPFSSVVGCPIMTQPDPKQNTVVLGGMHGAFGDDHASEVGANAAAIVALHNAYPDLRAMIDAQAATIARLREAAKRIADHPNFYITACECGEPECATTQFIAAIAEAEGAA